METSQPPNREQGLLPAGLRSFRLRNMSFDSSCKTEDKMSQDQITPFPDRVLSQKKKKPQQSPFPETMSLGSKGHLKSPASLHPSPVSHPSQFCPPPNLALRSAPLFLPTQDCHGIVRKMTRVGALASDFGSLPFPQHYGRLHKAGLRAAPCLILPGPDPPHTHALLQVFRRTSTPAVSVPL